MGHLIQSITSRYWSEGGATPTAWDEDGRPIDGIVHERGWSETKTNRHYVYCDACGGWTVTAHRALRGLAEMPRLLMAAISLTSFLLLLGLVLVPRSGRGLMIAISVLLGLAVILLGQRLAPAKSHWFVCDNCGHRFTEKLHTESNPLNYAPEQATAAGAPNWSATDFS